MKLFVWSNPYDVPWGHSLLIAIAENVDAAREQAKHGLHYSDVAAPTDVVLGEPDRVVDLPCAEWYEFSE